MDLASQPVTAKHRDAYYWRLLATAASFALFGLGGLCLRLLVFPLLGCLPGDALVHRLDLPVKLSQLNITPDDIPYLSQGATEVQRLIKNVPMPVEKNQIEEIYRSIR